MRDIDVEDDNAEKILGRFTGLKVASIVRSPDSGESFPQGDNNVDITFEDGSQLHLTSWGYDASGIITTAYIPPALQSHKPE